MTAGQAIPPAESRARRRRRWLLPLAAAAAAFVLLLSPLWAPVLMRRMDFFRVRHVEIAGARYVQPRDILERLRVDTLASVWDPSDPLERRVAEHPLVREVHVGRKLPGTIVVRIVEHVPVALVPGAAGFRAYDERGVVLPIDPTAADVDVPIAPRADTALLRLLGTVRASAPRLYQRLSEVRREPPGELLLVMDSMSIRALPDVTVQRLVETDAVEMDLARRRLRARELDLRFRDQVVARLQ